MSVLTAILSLFVFSTAKADQPKFSGEFVFRNQIVWSIVLVRENVDTATSVGKLRLDQLKSQGFICTSALRSVFKCVQQSHELPTPDAIQQKARELAQQASLAFGPLTSAELVNESEILQEWEFQQSITFASKKHDHFHVYSSKQAPAKLKITESTDESEATEDDSIWLNQIDPAKWAWSQVISDIKGPQRFEYFFDVLLEAPLP